MWCKATNLTNPRNVTLLMKIFRSVHHALVVWQSSIVTFPTLLQPPWGRRGRIRPQHPLACRKRRLNGAACLPWAATRVAWGKDPGGWGLRLTAMSSGSNTPLWPLLVLDGRLNLARFNQSAGRAEPRTTDNKEIWAQLGCIEVLYI